VPGIFVDYVVVDPAQTQTDEGEYNPAFRGLLPEPLEAIAPMPLNQRKIITRRAAMQLTRGAIVNLGFGIPDGVAAVAAEEGFLDAITLSIEQGVVGGIPAQGAIFGVARNPEAILNAPSIFDFYSGNGLDMTCLGLAQADAAGNVNVSKFGPTIAGCGGFIDISQSAKTLIFCGTFTAGGLEIEIRDGGVKIVKEGRSRKFVKQVEQITYSGAFGWKAKQKVWYVTERAVFELTPHGLMLTETAPGIDIERDILAQMDFVPAISDALTQMDARIFKDAPMGLSGGVGAKGEGSAS
jgi:propionate CoA-transferase